MVPIIANFTTNTHTNAMPHSPEPTKSLQEINNYSNEKSQFQNLLHPFPLSVFQAEALKTARFQPAYFQALSSSLSEG